MPLFVPVLCVWVVCVVSGSVPCEGNCVMINDLKNEGGRPCSRLRHLRFLPIDNVMLVLLLGIL